MVDDVLHLGEVGVAHGRDAELPALVLAQTLAAPVGDVEGRVGEDEVGFEVGKAIVVKGVALLDAAFDAADGQVHLGQAPGGVVEFLAVNAELSPGAAAVAVAGGVGFDELHRLDEHARGAAAGVIDAALEGFEHLYEQADDAAGGIEFAALLALRAGELAEEILIDAPEHVLGAGVGIAHADVGDEVNELPKALLVQGGPGVVPGEYTLERGVVALNGLHRLVHDLSDGSLAGVLLKPRPAGLGRHPEDVLGAVLVGVLRVSVGLLCKALLVLLKGIGDVLEENQPQDDVLVLCGVHRAAQGVGHLPELGLVTNGGAGGFGYLPIVPLLHQ